MQNLIVAGSDQSCPLVGGSLNLNCPGVVCFSFESVTLQYLVPWEPETRCFRCSGTGPSSLTPVVLLEQVMCLVMHRAAADLFVLGNPWRNLSDTHKVMVPVAHQFPTNHRTLSTRLYLWWDPLVCLSF